MDPGGSLLLVAPLFRLHGWSFKISLEIAAVQRCAVPNGRSIVEHRYNCCFAVILAVITAVIPAKRQDSQRLEESRWKFRTRCNRCWARRRRSPKLRNRKNGRAALS